MLQNLEVNDPKSSELFTVGDKLQAQVIAREGVEIGLLILLVVLVNGPGEMADADFGYVGSGVGKITLYKGKEVVKRNIDSEIAVEELINLLKENSAWVDVPETV